MEAETVHVQSIWVCDSLIELDYPTTFMFSVLYFVIIMLCNCQRKKGKLVSMELLKSNHSLLIHFSSSSNVNEFAHQSSCSIRLTSLYWLIFSYCSILLGKSYSYKLCLVKSGVLFIILYVFHCLVYSSLFFFAITASSSNNFLCWGSYYAIFT